MTTTEEGIRQLNESARVLGIALRRAWAQDLRRARRAFDKAAQVLEEAADRKECEGEQRTA